MNLELWKSRGREPSDQEIERDVLELRQLLEGINGPKEPHPAYYQNFLVKVRGRIDEDRFRRRRVAPAAVWASLSAAAVAVALVIGGVFSPSVPDVAVNGNVPTVTASPNTADKTASEPLFAEKSAESSDLLAANVSESMYGDGAQSLVLNNEDVKLLNAIMTDDDNALFQAIVDSKGS